jgi:hypothetical protein
VFRAIAVGFARILFRAVLSYRTVAVNQTAISMRNLDPAILAFILPVM